MAKKTVSLSVEEEVYEEYRRYCEQKGIILSKQFENFMVEELKKNKSRSWSRKLPEQSPASYLMRKTGRPFSAPSPNFILKEFLLPQKLEPPRNTGTAGQ